MSDSGTPSNSRSNSPISSREEKHTENHAYRTARDTLINEDTSSDQTSLPLPLPPKSPRVSPIFVSKSSTLPLNTKSNDVVPSKKPTNGKTIQNLDQPPELPPKTSRITTTLNKPSDAYLFNSASNETKTKRDPQNDRMPTLGATAMPEIRPVHRSKSKTHRRKMTEDEAVEQLEPIAAKDDPLTRFVFKKKLGSG